jgi:ATP-dependent protease HslVU (ClpYQ) peptidase subunit
MTAIIGFRDTENKLWLAGDSYVGDSGADSKGLTGSPKVYSFEAHKLIVGLCGSPKHEMVLEELLIKELNKKDFVLTHEWLKYKLPSLMRAKCRKMGVIELDEDKEEVMGQSSFLFGFDKTFYYFDCNFSFWATSNPVVGIGIASPYALGAMTVLYELDKFTQEEKLTMCLDASANLSHYVSKPYAIVSV